MSTATQGTNEQLIRFVSTVPAEGRALMSFRDPVMAHALVARSRDNDGDSGDKLLLTVYPFGGAEESFAEWTARVAGPDVAQPIYLKARGVELWWSAASAVLQCDAEESAALQAAVVEFTFYAAELRRLEEEIAGSWQELDADRPLAYDVTAADLPGSAAFGERMGRTFQRRMRFARLEPHLYTPDPAMRASAQKLGSDLREKANVEARAEALDAHIEVFEHIYEMASQRTGEFRAAHQGHRVEWIIIWLLVAEVTLSLVQVVLKR